MRETILQILEGCVYIVGALGILFGLFWLFLIIWFEVAKMFKFTKGFGNFLFYRKQFYQYLKEKNDGKETNN